MGLHSTPARIGALFGDDVNVDGGGVTDGPPPIIVKTPPGGGGGRGFPGPVAPVKAAWLPDGRYRLQSGDTLSGVAATYLRDPARWREIWNLQPNHQSKSPDKVPAGLVLEMPEEARKRARELGVLGMSGATKLALAAGAVVLAIGAVVAVEGASK